MFGTGQGNREASVTNYTKLVDAVQMFQTKYEMYRPYRVRGDAQFLSDVTGIRATVEGLRDTVETGDLYEAHLALETVRPVLQDILRRIGFSLLAVALIDFHDAMELMLTPAEEGDAEGVLAAYPEANTKL